MKKKVILLWLGLMLVSGVYASDYEYEVEIVIEHVEGLETDFSTMKSMFSNDHYSGTSIMKSDIDVVIKGNVITLRTNHKAGLNYVFEDDLGDWGYYMQGVVEAKDLDHHKKLVKILKISDLDRVEVSHDLEGTIEMGLYNENLKNNLNDFRCSWQSLGQSKKTLYLSRGRYESVVAQKSDDTLGLYSQEILKSTEHTYAMQTVANKAITYNISTPESYGAYDFISVHAEMASDEILKYKTIRPENTMVLSIDEGFTKSGLEIFISDEAMTKIIDIGRKSTIALLPQAYCSGIRSYMDRDKNMVQWQFNDFNGNERQHYGQYFTHDLVMDVYDLEDKFIASQVLSSTMDSFDVTLNHDQTYKALVHENSDEKDSLVSIFELSFSDGLVRLVLTGLDHVDYSYSHEIKFIDDQDKYTAQVTCYNESDIPRTYRIMTTGTRESDLATFDLKPRQRKITTYSLDHGETIDGIKILCKDVVMNTQKIDQGYANDFTGHWAEKSIQKTLENGILDLEEDHNFRPDAYLSRGQFVKALVKVLHMDLKDSEELKTFRDIGDSHELKAYIDIACSHNLIDGYPDGDFKAHEAISRQNAAVIIHRAMEETKNPVVQEVTCEDFIDGYLVDDYAKKGLNYCASREIISGRPGMLLDVFSSVSRGEAALMLDKIMVRIEEKH